MILDREQFVKALECCLKAKTFGDCEDLGCPACRKEGCLYTIMGYGDSESQSLENGLLEDAYELIRELTEECKKWQERLDREAKCQYDLAGKIVDLEAEVAQVKADTVRKMQERLKADMHNVARVEFNGILYYCISDKFVDQIAKEMLEET